MTRTDESQRKRLSISLPPELFRAVEDRVSSGLYGSESEVVREGLRLLLEQDELRRARLEQLRQKVGVGLDELDRGEGVPADRVFAELREGLRTQD